MFILLLPETLCQGCRLLQHYLPTLLCPGDLSPCCSALPETQGSHQQGSCQHGHQGEPQQGVRQQNHPRHYGACVDATTASTRSLPIYLSSALMEHLPTSGRVCGKSWGWPNTASSQLVLIPTWTAWGQSPLSLRPFSAGGLTETSPHR